MKKWINKQLHRFCRLYRRLLIKICCLEERSNPWRCEECGSKRVSFRTWLDSNTLKGCTVVEDQEDLWCEDCDEHTRQVRESELMQEVVEPWWEYGMSEKERESITGFRHEEFRKDDIFRALCQRWWKRQPNEEKIRIWSSNYFNTEKYGNRN